MHLFYKLNTDKSVSPCTAEEHALDKETMPSIHIAQDIVNGKWVSTVWVGIALDPFNGGKPLLFETMVFPSVKKRQNIYCDRYHTYDEAIEGHKKAKKWVLDGCRDE